jgi:sugar lactone lactonase YvrE
MISAAGVVSTIAGTGAQGAMNGPAASATFYGPSSVTLDRNGNLYIADTENNLIREISGGIVSTFAGTGATTPVVNGPGASATFFHPDGTAIDNTGDILVADASNNLIRLITSSGYVSTVAGSGAAAETNGTGTAAAFNGPIGVAIDGSGNIYVADLQGNTIRKIVP